MFLYFSMKVLVFLDSTYTMLEVVVCFQRDVDF